MTIRKKVISLYSLPVRDGVSGARSARCSHSPRRFARY
jgi:hypothetical protein